MQTLPTWLQIAMAVVPTLSALFAGIALLLNAQQFRRASAQARATLVASFLRDFAGDRDMSVIFYEIEYGRFRYGADFHGSPQERPLDKLLMHFSNLALAWQSGLLKDVDIAPVQYFVRVLLRDEGVIEYLKFVDQYAAETQLGAHPYIALGAMGKSLGVDAQHLTPEAVRMNDEKTPPKGSGWFAVVCAVLFGAAGIITMVVAPITIEPQYIAGSWFLCVAMIPGALGVNRIIKGRKDSTIGQETITLVLALVVGSVALLDFLYRSGT